MPFLFEPLIEPMLQIAGIQPADIVLDVGCGTGIVARSVASTDGFGGAVTGLDINPGMLTVAKERAAEEGLSIDWIEGSATELPFPDSTFTTIFCSQALQFFPNQLTVLKEIHRICDDDGRFILSVWPELKAAPDLFQQLDVSTQRHLGFPMLQTVYTFGEAELNQLLTNAGFGGVTITTFKFTARFPQVDQFVPLQVAAASAAIPAAISDLQQLSDSDRATLTAAIQDEMQPAIDRYTKGGELHIPTYSYIASARG